MIHWYSDWGGITLGRYILGRALWRSTDSRTRGHSGIAGFAGGSGSAAEDGDDREGCLVYKLDRDEADASSAAARRLAARTFPTSIHH